jgi:hypothetical protein
MKMNLGLLFSVLMQIEDVWSHVRVFGSTAKWLPTMGADELKSESESELKSVSIGPPATMALRPSPFLFLCCVFDLRLATSCGPFSLFSAYAHVLWTSYHALVAGPM